jgi:hypothetical protein
LILDEPQLSEEVKGDLLAGCVYEAAERADGRPGGAAANGSVHGSCGGQQRCSFSFFSLAESSYRSASHQVRIPLKLGCGVFFFLFLGDWGGIPRKKKWVVSNVVFLRAIFQLFLKQLIFLFLLPSSIVREVGF